MKRDNWEDTEDQQFKYWTAQEIADYRGFVYFGHAVWLTGGEDSPGKQSCSDLEVPSIKALKKTMKEIQEQSPGAVCQYLGKKEWCGMCSYHSWFSTDNNDIRDGYERCGNCGGC